MPLYAILTKYGHVIGDVEGKFEDGKFEDGYVDCAGAVAIDGTPVNSYRVKLSLYKQHLEEAAEMPRFKRMEKQTGGVPPGFRHQLPQHT